MRAASHLDPEAAEAVYDRIQEYVGRELDGGRAHTEEILIVSGARRWAARVVFFVDVDGTLNVVSIEAA